MKKLIIAVAVWPLTELYWMIPGRFDFPFFVTAAMAILFLLEADMEQQVAFNFDMPTGDELKRQALAEMEAKYPRWIDFAREKARRHATIYGRVSSNDIHAMIDAGELPPPPHHNAMGAIFRKGFIQLPFRVDAEHAASRNRGGGVAVWGLA